MTQDANETTNLLNLVGEGATRAFINLDCRLFYWWDEIREMVDEGKSEDQILHCMDMYRERLACMVRECGEWNERMYTINKDFFPDLIHPDICRMKAMNKALYGTEAGAK